jgi:hypothetical protein
MEPPPIERRLTERQRQRDRKRYQQAHDSEHDNATKAHYTQCYVLSS